MKFTILSQYYPPEVGAPQARLSELALAFVRRGHQVTILTAMPSYPLGKIHDGYGGLYSKEIRDGVDVIRTFIYPTQSPKLFSRLMNYFSFVMSSSILGALLLRRPDYLLVESPPLFLGMAGLFLSYLKRTRLIFNVSDLWPESAVQLGLLKKDTLGYRISAKLEALCYRQAWLVTGQSKSILANIKERFPDSRTFHLSNAVDTARFKPEQRTETARGILTSNGSCVALYAGLHGLAQGLDQVLAGAEIMGEESGVKFVLIGDGPEKKRLVREAQERSIANVAFLEISAAKDIPALLASADVALVTLKTHISGAVPSKLYEAMASGLPVVLVAEGEAAEIVQQHDAGITVRPGDVNGLIKAIQALVNDPRLRRRLGKNGRRVAEKYFDRTIIANRFIDHLETELSSSLPG